MALITKSFASDEKTWQNEFYSNLFGDDFDGITIDRSTDGYTRGILFEHKTNIQSYGESKALGQALIYLARFNRDGVPVPAKICLVGQEEQKCYVYDTENYMSIVGDIPKYANMKASDGIPGFSAGARTELICFDMRNPLRGMLPVLEFVRRAPQTVKVEINSHNVYGWANFYYDHASEYKQKPEKKKFFEELRRPTGTLEAFIQPWQGQESDFKYIMDILNDPMTQKKLGAFYTPPAYAKKASDLVRQAIARVPAGNDYVIIDRCAGTGNLQMYLDDGNEDVLSHCILSTYELKEWMVLKDRYAGRVRYIIPPVPARQDDLPGLNEEGFLTGANALSRDIIENPEVRKYLDDPHCTIILFENPPYIETTSVEFQKRGKGGESSTWKQDYVASEMKMEVSGTATNDIGNAFIWSAFKYFLRQPTDSYIVFSPIKYWKAQHLINKKYMNGFCFNRRHFHTDIDACVTVIYWSNEDANISGFELDGYDLDERYRLTEPVKLPIRRIRDKYSDKYYDKRVFSDDEQSGVLLGYNGLPNDAVKNTLKPTFNKNIIGYMVADSSNFDNPDLMSVLIRCGLYKGHGFYLRSDNFLEKLPMFAASRYVRYNRSWTERARIMKSADKAAQFFADCKAGILDSFLCKCLIFTCFELQNHCRSFTGTDGRFYRNELCLDTLDGKQTVASEQLRQFISQGYELTEEESALLKKWDTILEKIRETDEYDPSFSYGPYQIDNEINVKIQQGFKNDGTPNMVTKYGDLNNLLKDLKRMVGDYYLHEIVPMLFEYEFLK